MKSLRIPLSVALTTTTFLTGCGLFSDTRRNLAHEAHMTRDDYFVKKQHYRLAEDSLREFNHSGPGYALSEDFHCGYLEGYVDYLDKGGNGEPELTPPKGYRVETYYTPEVRAALENYYAGFRAGSRTAQASNVRSLRVLPLGGPVSGEDIRRPIIYSGSNGPSASLPASALPSQLLPAPMPNPVPGTMVSPPMLPYQPPEIPPESAPRLPTIDPNAVRRGNRFPATPASRSPGLLPSDPSLRSLPPLPPSLRNPSPYGAMPAGSNVQPVSGALLLPQVNELPGVP